MEQKKFPDFISFLDDNDEQRNWWTIVFKVNSSLVEFMSPDTQKIITIPFSRVKKVMQAQNINRELLLKEVLNND